MKSDDSAPESSQSSSMATVRIKKRGVFSFYFKNAYNCCCIIYRKDIVVKIHVTSNFDTYASTVHGLLYIKV